MVRKLKTYQASQSFLRSRCRSALDEGRSRSVRREQQSFYQDFAKESEDNKVIAAAMEKPGIVLRLPVALGRARRLGAS
jgi:hypothetical protein